MKRITLISLTLLMLCHSIAMGQDFHFHKLGIHDGLSNNSVNTLHVDNRGFLWIGTAFGLNRYDGYNVKTFYNINNNRENPLVNVINIEEDALGNLWIESDMPLTRYDYHTNRFDIDNSAYLGKLGFYTGKEYKLRTDSEGSIWIISKDSIEYKNLADNAAPEQWHTGLGLKDARTWHAEIYNGEAYITDGVSLWHFSTRTSQTRRITLPPVFLSDKGHIRLYIDTEGLVWIYSMISEHICYMPSLDNNAPTLFNLSDETTETAATASKSNAIRRIFDDGQGKIWIATDHSGIFLFDKGNGHLDNIRHNNAVMSTLAADNVTCITADRQGTIWAGHQNSGISYCNQKYNMFRHHNNITGDISTMLFDRKGNLWIGTDGNGLYIEHHDGKTEKTLVPNITISSLLEDRNGNIWVGTYNAGLLKMNGNRIEKSFTAENGHLPHNSVRQMCEDNDGNIWFTSVFEPIACFNTSHEKAFVYRNNNTSYHGTSIANDRQGKIFCGTFYGILEYDTKTKTSTIRNGNKKGSQNFLQQVIGPLHIDHANQLMWVGHITGISLWDIKNDTIYYIDKTSGLLDTNIKGIINDADNNTWISTAQGLSRIKIEKRQPTLSLTITNFTENEGIQTEFFNAYAATANKKGEVYMGGKDGYTHVIPSKTQEENEKLSVIFADVSIGDSIVSLSEGNEWRNATLHIKHNDLQVGISFFTGNLISTNHIMFSYRLKGLHDKWMTTSNNNVTFYSLPAGRYTLEVKACGENGEWGDVSQLQIVVSPPFYLSWWMILLYAGIITAIAFIIWRKKVKRTENRVSGLKIKDS